MTTTRPGAGSLVGRAGGSDRSSSAGPIVHVVCTDAFAGVERYVATVAAGQAARGHDVIVVGGRGERMVPLLQPAGALWVHGADPAEAGARLTGLAARGCLGRWSTRAPAARRPAVVHAHMTAAELAAVATGLLHRAPVVATRHFAQTRGSSGPARLIGSVLSGRLSGQLAVSRFVADAIEGPSVVAHPGTADRPPGPPPAERDRVVLVAQRLEPEKRTDLALEAWQISGLERSGWRLAIAGAGQERAQLRAQAERLGLAESVDFLGGRSDIEELQRRAAILLAPRPDEAFGLTVVEAMAAGLPVVAAAGGGHLETVGAVPGAALYEPLDTRRAGRLLADLAADPDRRATYGAALRAVQQDRFSIAGHVDATLDLYAAARR